MSEDQTTAERDTRASRLTESLGRLQDSRTGFALARGEDTLTEEQIDKLKALRADYAAFAEANPSIARFAAFAGPVLGIGPLAAACAVVLHQDWID